MNACPKSCLNRSTPPTTGCPHRDRPGPPAAAHLCWILVIISSAALVSQSAAQVLPYYRPDELRRIEEELLRFDKIPGVRAPDSRERLRMRLQVESDQNYVRAQKTAGAEALIAVAEELHHRWQADSPSGYIAVLGLASSLLLDFSTRSDLTTTQATRFGSNLLALLPTVPLSAASMGAGILANEHIWRPRKFFSVN